MNQYNFHIDHDISGVEIMSAVIHSQKTHAHVHEEYAIGVMEKGIQSYDPKNRNSKYMIRGDIPVVNPYTLHHSENLDNKGFQYRMFYIEKELVQQISHELYSTTESLPLFNHFSIRDSYAEQHLLQLHKTLENNLFTPIQKQNYLYEVLSYLIKNHSTLKKQHLKFYNNQQAISNVIDYIHTNFRQKIELKEIAKIAALSPYHLNRIFTKAKGITPHQYLINLRLNEARKLLKKKHKPTHIAHEIGFFDQAHFTRNFKLFLGITPKQYQQQIT